MQTVLTVVHITTCIFLALVVLVQSGKGAEISTSLGGSSQTVFGSSGGANFFTRLTAGLAIVFMCTSVTLTLLGARAKRSVFEGTAAPVTSTAPAATATAPTTPAAPAVAKPAAAESAPKH